MAQIATIILCFLTLSVFSQNEDSIVTIKESKITSVVLTVDNIDKIKAVNWQDVKDILKKSNDSIRLGFRVKNNLLADNKLKFKHSFDIKTKAENIDETIEIAKKVIKIIDNLN